MPRYVPISKTMIFFRQIESEFNKEAEPSENISSNQTKPINESISLNLNIENVDERKRLEYDTDDGELISILADNEDDDSDVVTSRRDASAKFGRRASRQFKPFVQNQDSSAEILANNLTVSPLDALPNATRRNSAKYGRRSQSHFSSRSSSTSSTVVDESQRVHSNSSSNVVIAESNDSKISDVRLLSVLEQCTLNYDESPSRKNSAKYGRRATSRNNSLIYVDNEEPLISVPQAHEMNSYSDIAGNRQKIQTWTDKSKLRDTKYTQFNYSNKTLEESWTSLNIFNKKHKGRICKSLYIFPFFSFFYRLFRTYLTISNLYNNL